MPAKSNSTTLPSAPARHLRRARAGCEALNMNETPAQPRGDPCSSWARTLEARTVSQGQHLPRAACGNEPEILPGGHPRG